MNILKWMDDHIEEVLLVVFSFTMVFIIALQVFMRFVLSSSLSWSEELARYCFIWMVYIGISYGVKQQRHLKVDAALLLLKNKGQLVLNIVANLLFLSFTLVIIYYGYLIAERLLAFGQTSPALHIPMGLIYMATPIGMGLTAFRIIQQLIQQFRSLRGEGHFEVKTEYDLILESHMDDEMDKVKVK